MFSCCWLRVYLFQKLASCLTHNCFFSLSRLLYLFHPPSSVSLLCCWLLWFFFLHHHHYDLYTSGMSNWSFFFLSFYLYLYLKLVVHGGRTAECAAVKESAHVYILTHTRDHWDMKTGFLKMNREHSPSQREIQRFSIVYTRSTSQNNKWLAVLKNT